MKGIRYIIDASGRKRAVVVNLDVYGNIWEDIYDALIVESRKNEPRVKWEDVKKRLRKKNEL